MGTQVEVGALRLLASVDSLDGDEIRSLLDGAMVECGACGAVTLVARAQKHADWHNALVKRKKDKG